MTSKTIVKGLRRGLFSDTLMNMAADKIEELEAALCNKPAADAAEVKHGEWVHTDLADHWLGKDECSECHYHNFQRTDVSNYAYCPNCGAKMDGGDNK